MNTDIQSTTGLDISSWENVAPAYTELQARRLESARDIEAWLEDWSRLAERVREEASILSIARSQDTEDPERREAYLSYLKTVYPKLHEAEHELRRKLLDSGWARPDMTTVIRDFRVEEELFREENVPLLAEDRALSTRYSEIVGGITVDFDGKERTLPQLEPYRAYSDRSIREAAWRAGAEAMLDVRGELDDLFDELLALRQRIAHNAGYDNYLEYRWSDLGRHDYTIEDAEAFHAAIREAAVPALKRAQARRARDLGLDNLRPWDANVDPYGHSPLAPFASADQLIDTSAAIFDQLDSELGDRVRTMRDEGLLDLDNRKGKAPGGYCASLPTRRLPFIFMNAVGTADNVRTMLHEVGHAFHTFEHAGLPLVWQRGSPIEFAEVASMSMELLTGPFLGIDEGGFYDEVDAIRSRVEHLDRMIQFLPYMATVSSFQHWLYRASEPDRDARDAAWRRIYLEFNTGFDWSGLEETLESLWHHKLHIFTYPLYYIEYGLAQMGALQVWRRSLNDPETALADYRAALALGRTRPLPELFQHAGAEMVFTTDQVAPLIAVVEEALERDLERLKEL